MIKVFRSPNNGNFLSKALFYEKTQPDEREFTIYTLKDEDHIVDGRTFVSLYKLYMSSEDSTEYEFATTHLGGWAHWEDLMNTVWFKPYIARWRREHEVRAKAKALNKIRSIAKSNDKEAFQANKFLLEKNWEPKNTKGRPTKEQIREAAKDEAEKMFQVDNDLERISPAKAIN